MEGTPREMGIYCIIHRVVAQRESQLYEMFLSLFCNSSEKDTDDVEMEEFETLPTIEEAAMMAAGIHWDDDAPESEGLVILPHQLPRPVYTPPSPPPAVEPLYKPVDGKPVGK